MCVDVCRSVVIFFDLDSLFIALRAWPAVVHCTGLIPTFAVHSTLFFLILPPLSLQWVTADATTEVFSAENGAEVGRGCGGSEQLVCVSIFN